MVLSICNYAYLTIRAQPGLRHGAWSYCPVQELRDACVKDNIALTNEVQMAAYNPVCAPRGRVCCVRCVDSAP